jgi:hypothetical protein
MKKRTDLLPGDKVEQTIHDLLAMGILENPQFTSIIREPTGPDAERVQHLPDYAKARQSAQTALLRLYAQTAAAQVGVGTSGLEFTWELGLHRVGQGFITETPTTPLPLVVALGQKAEGPGSIRKIQQALHNAEKLTEPKPQELRDLNRVRTAIVCCWLNQHLWLMRDDTITDWFNRKCRSIKPGGIIRQTVTKIISELGLRKSRRLLVKRLNKQDQFVFDTSHK